MDTSVWGPTMWKTLHLITFSYPEKPSFSHRKQFYDFFNNLRYIIPCVYCRKNYIEHLNEIPIEPYLEQSRKVVEEGNPEYSVDSHMEESPLNPANFSRS